MSDGVVHYKLGTFTGFACGETTGISTTIFDDVECLRCRAILRQADLDPAPERPIWSRPIKAIQVNDISINGDQFEMGSFHHDVNKGTVTITFVNVEVLHTIYADLEGS